MNRFRSFYLWRQLKPHWPVLLGAALVLFVQVALNVLAPLPVKFILNHVMGGGPDTLHLLAIRGWEFGHFKGASLLLLFSLAMLMIGAAFAFSLFGERLIAGRLTYKIAENIRRDFFSRIFTRRQAYLDSKKKVDILGRLSGDVANLEALLIAGFPAIVQDLPMICILLGMMFFVDFRLTLIFSLFLPAFYLCGRYFTKKMRGAFKSLRRRTVTFEEESYEALSAMAVVKSLRGEDKIREKLFGRASELRQLSRNSLIASIGLEASMEFTHHLVKAFFLFLGCWAIFRGEIRLGDLFQLMAYMAIISKCVNNLNKFLSKFPKIQASMERLEDLDSELELNPETSGKLPLSPEIVRAAPQAMSFERVSLQYEGERSILDSYTFDLPKSQLVAVVGASGAGKTTFSRLLNRLLDPAEGELKIAGIDLRQFDIKSLRSLVRTISQETFLVSGTVRENLLLAAKHPVTDDEIKSALGKVNALDFVNSLPKGLDTLIGEGGLQLSGGEAQRLHLSRAFLDRESEILLFDEPTTGLDTLSAQKVVGAIHELVRRKTLVLWVTHRMQEVPGADGVLFFRRDGNPVFATHEELLLNSGAYRELMADTARPDKVAPLNLVNEVEDVPIQGHVLV